MTRIANTARTNHDRPSGSAKREGRDALEASIRPQSLTSSSARSRRAPTCGLHPGGKARGDALDHVLFAGPPGLGKTTLAQIMAKELGVGFRATSGPVISKAGDLAALLTNLEERDVLFIDEIHRLNPAVEEILYPAMEDFQLDLIIGEGPAARSVRIDLAKFTLVGATTRAGLLTTPLRDRFGIPVRLNFYTDRRTGAGRDARRARPRRADIRATAPARSRGARAARPASPAACCAGSATSRPCRCGDHRRRGGRPGTARSSKSTMKASTRSTTAI